MSSPLFKVVFFNQGKTYELLVEHVRQAELFGFVELSGFRFGLGSSLVIDPSEERLRAEFNGVERTLVPLHAVVRIDVVGRGQEGSSKIIDSGEGSNVRPFPTPLYTSDKPPDR